VRIYYELPRGIITLSRPFGLGFKIPASYCTETKAIQLIYSL